MREREEEEERQRERGGGVNDRERKDLSNYTSATINRIRLSMETIHIQLT